MKLKSSFVLLVICVILRTHLFAASGLDIRIQHESIDLKESELNVKIQVRTYERLVLGGQNLRVYYPTAALSINTIDSRSELNQLLYSELSFVQIFENAQASGIGNISFEHDLGLASMFIELKDIINGGRILSPEDGWITLATLNFDIIGQFDHLEILLARPEISQEYATAFTELASWIEPYTFDRIVINDYHDYYYRLPKQIDHFDISTTIGPNPTPDYLSIYLSEEVSEEIYVVIHDITGKRVKKEVIRPNSIYHSMDLSHLDRATYFLTLHFSDRATDLLTSRIVVAR